jgi:nucleotide-binding universal stress UspA family protein
MRTKKNNSILVGTDFSAASKSAIQLAIQLGEKSGERIVIFHACYFNEVKNAGTLLYPEAMKASLLQAQQKIEQIIQQNFSTNKNILFESHVQFGESSVKEITSAAKRKRSNLVIIGTQGANNLKKKIFGTTAIQTMQHSKIPVLAVPSGYYRKNLINLIYFTDLTQTQKELKYIRAFATQYQLNLEAVFLDAGWAQTIRETDNLIYLDKQNILFHRERVRVENPLSVHIRDFMKKKPNSIACLFHKNRSPIASLFGGNISPQLMRNFNFPILIFQKKED